MISLQYIYMTFVKIYKYYVINNLFFVFVVIIYYLL
jgi:hypothetical protein